MRNIDLFNLHVAEVLGICFESFPVRPDIRYEDLGVNAGLKVTHLLAISPVEN